MWRARVRTGVVAVALIGASVTARAQCSTDMDCKGERVCEDGVCTDPQRPSAAVGPAPSEPTPAPPTVEPPQALGPARVLVVNSPPSSPAIRYERRSDSLVGIGVAMTLAGSIGLGMGVYSSVAPGLATCWRELSEDFREEHCKRDHNVAAYVVGGLLLAGAIPLMIIGGKPVPVKSEARLVPWLSPQSGGLLLDVKL